MLNFENVLRAIESDEKLFFLDNELSLTQISYYYNDRLGVKEFPDIKAHNCIDLDVRENNFDK